MNISFSTNIHLKWCIFNNKVFNRPGFGNPSCLLSEADLMLNVRNYLKRQTYVLVFIHWGVTLYFSQIFINSSMVSNYFRDIWK